MEYYQNYVRVHIPTGHRKSIRGRFRTKEQFVALLKTWNLAPSLWVYGPIHDSIQCEEEADHFVE